MLGARATTPSGTEDGPNDFWALRDVSFDVRKGDIVGIIGSNGAGKSTLLKVLTRITEPTYGEALVRGRVGSLLEVGTGFHPELTGRENIYLNGTILGMNRGEIDQKLDEIVTFSQIEPFIDTPVKRYSSGMYVRLAFSVAAHLESEILLVDEVLAVGDAAFQKKCLGKMGDVVGQGRTILFVSHNMTAVKGLCSRAFWLDHGRLRMQGDVKHVVSEYLRSTTHVNMERSWAAPGEAPGNEHVRLKGVCVRPCETVGPEGITIRTPLDIEMEYWNCRPGARLHVNLTLYDENNVCVFMSTPLHEPNWHGREFPEGLFRSVCHVPGDLLNDGRYRIRLAFVRDASIVLYRLRDALVFDVSDSDDRRGEWYGKFDGVVRPLLDWKTERLR
jgi:lipopolysaccharide transport system ATP-binding protein